MQIKYYRRNVYGNTLLYPLDHVDSLAALTGRKTLTEAHVAALTAIGIEMVEVIQPKEPQAA